MLLWEESLLLRPAVRITSSAVSLACLPEAAVAQEDSRWPPDTSTGRTGATVMATIIKGQIVPNKVTAGMLGCIVVEATIGVLAETEVVRGAGPINQSIN